MLRYVAMIAAILGSNAAGQVEIVQTERALLIDGSISEEGVEGGSGFEEAMWSDPVGAMAVSFDVGGYVICNEVRSLRLMTNQAAEVSGDTLSVQAASGVGMSICGELPSGDYTIENDFRIEFEIVSTATFELLADLRSSSNFGVHVSGTRLRLLRLVGSSSDTIAYGEWPGEPQDSQLAESGVLEPGVYALEIVHESISDSFEDLPRPTDVPYAEEEVYTVSLTIDGLGDALGEACGAADLAAPFGDLDIADVVEFLRAFGAGESDADLAAPFGMFDIADVVEFLRVFGAGCP